MLVIRGRWLISRFWRELLRMLLFIGSKALTLKDLAEKLLASLTFLANMLGDANSVSSFQFADEPRSLTLY
jgi:DNA repair protein RadC